MFDHGVVFIVTPCALLLLSTAVQIILDLFPTFSVVCSIAARPPQQQPPPIQMHCGIINSLAGSTVQCPHGVRVYELTILCFYHSIANRSGNCNAGDLAVNKVAGTRSPIPSPLIGRHAEKKLWAHSCWWALRVPQRVIEEELHSSLSIDRHYVTICLFIASSWESTFTLSPGHATIACDLHQLIIIHILCPFKLHNGAENPIESL